MKIKVAIAEDNNLLAESIKEKLELFPQDISFEHRASNGEQLLEFLSKKKSINTILMDIEMPVMDGIKATELCSAKFPGVKIIMLTVFDDEDRIFKAIQAGAKGYLLKDESPEKIHESIKMIMEGGAPMSPTIAAKSLALLRNVKHNPAVSESENFDLSKREIEVLEELSNGLDYNRIAEKLFISPSTVRKHIENIYKKLQVNNKVTAVQKASKHNII